VTDPALVLLHTSRATAYLSCYCIPLVLLHTSRATAYLSCYCIPLVLLHTWDAPVRRYLSCSNWQNALCSSWAGLSFIENYKPEWAPGTMAEYHLVSFS